MNQMIPASQSPESVLSFFDVRAFDDGLRLSNFTVAEEIRIITEIVRSDAHRPRDRIEAMKYLAGRAREVARASGVLTQMTKTMTVEDSDGNVISISQTEEALQAALTGRQRLSELETAVIPQREFEHAQRDPELLPEAHPPEQNHQDRTPAGTEPRERSGDYKPSEVSQAFGKAEDSPTTFSFTPEAQKAIDAALRLQQKGLPDAYGPPRPEGAPDDRGDDQNPF